MAFERIQALGTEKYNMIVDELSLGVPALAIAKKIQTDWGQFGDVSDITLAQQLRRLKYSLDFEKEVKSETKVEPKIESTFAVPSPSEENDVDIFSDSVDCQKELAELIAIQKKRIMNLVEKEKNMPMPFPNLGNMIKDCAGMIQELEQSQQKEVENVWSSLFEPTEGI